MDAANGSNGNVPSLFSVDVAPNPNIAGLDMGSEATAEESSGQQNTGPQSDFFVRVRGLPFATVTTEILAFFHDINVVGGENGVTFTFTRDGRASGEAYVCVASAEDQAGALRHNREHLGSRYIEVFEANRDEMEYVVKKSGPQPGSEEGDGVLRMRGLPFGCSKEEIVQFFAGYEIVPNGITMTTDMHGRTAGDAYVEFSSQSVAERAVTDKNMKRIGHRYIELFRSTSMEARQAAMGGGIGGSRRPMRPAPYDRSDRYGGPRGGYDSYSSPRDRFGGGGAGGRFKDFNNGGYGGADRYGGDRYGGGNGGFRNGTMRGGRGGGGGGGRPGMPPRQSVGNFKSSTGHSVHMRGLPFSATENDIGMFFSPLVPVQISLGMNQEGRKSGEADVDFDTHDEACEAMKKDKSNMEHRYIELFLNSSSMGGVPRARPPQRSDFGAPPPPEDRFNPGLAMAGNFMASMANNMANSMANSEMFKGPPGPASFGFNSMSGQGEGGYY